MFTLSQSQHDNDRYVTASRDSVEILMMMMMMVFVVAVVIITDLPY